MTYHDATAMAMAVQTGEISPLELVSQAIHKAKELNPILNAITSERFEAALEEAKQRDFSGKPFAGVPIFLKDLGQELKGDLSTSGSKLFKNHHATKTDLFVKRLEDLGFIILGRSNTPEFGFKNISDSQLHGPVSLPHDKTRNAGGSSGGAAALVSSGISALAPASDGGGSIRIPASFNGLIGLKPSRGRIPVGPGSYRGWQGASVHFALTKSVRDTRCLLYHLQMEQMESPFPLAKLAKEKIEEPLKRPLKIAFYQRLIDGRPVSADTSEALRQAVACLTEQGHHLVELQEFPVNMPEVIRHYYMMNSVETAAMFAGIETAFRRPMTKDDMETVTWAIYQSGKDIPAWRYSQVLQKWDAYSATMATFHESYDLLLTFTTNTPAPKHGELVPDSQLMARLAQAEIFSSEEQFNLVETMFTKSLTINPYTALPNLTGQPAISLPTYETKEGLPIGIQFIAAKGREDLLLGIAEQFELAGLLKTPQ
ncbi:amidase [Streptococcus dysgalactiae]|uniref:amidase n=1 Tax=Streptococcus dysgalactiae TaxID=1334 RepID=UPI0001F866BA|nr:amidase [Streptococcus dysgalactiae]EFY02829.1 amidase [Streptococcus dysgalactiae subsp. dysgalactiae ATCC 27957]MCB2830069.1 amidase [Streptococcus dysgalactiae subsp. dysgalactiae]MCB2832209.1 amidase [Streptococcus dysgalactiae subsp. dysgalactiae]MCB2835853.1 amidase [Streptococcus dysgalactiae subsp. dysgalactiae]MCB2838152.1 amidase [Streptococcus dysgalactiae subsp. dysgalactiae]